jgi:RNA polymerase sigma-70 factor (ECF subfamily)
MVASEDADKSLNRARLMERAQGGDREAFQALFQDIGPIITRFLRRRVRDQTDVEDVCQEALIGVFKSRHTYQTGRPFEPWLFAIVRNVASAYFRRGLQQAMWLESVGDLPETMAEEGSERTLELREAFSQLSPNQVEAVRLIKVHGLSVAEASRRTGASVGSIKVRVHRAYQSLKESIRR